MTPYKLKPRKMGEGRIRIGCSIELSEEIYTLCMVSQLKLDIIKEYLDVLSGQVVNEEGEIEGENIP